MAGEAGFGLLIHHCAHLGSVAGKKNFTLFAEYPHLADAFLGGHILEDVLDVGPLVAKHPVAGGVLDRLAELVGALDHLTGKNLLFVPDVHQSKTEHGDAKGQGHSQKELGIEATADQSHRGTMTHLVFSSQGTQRNYSGIIFFYYSTKAHGKQDDSGWEVMS